MCAASPARADTVVRLIKQMIEAATYRYESTLAFIVLPGPVYDSQTLNSLEFFYVVGNQDQSLASGMTSNMKIVHADDCSLTLQGCAYISIMSCCRIVIVQNINTGNGLLRWTICHEIISYTFIKPFHLQRIISKFQDYFSSLDMILYPSKQLLFCQDVSLYL